MLADFLEYSFQNVEVIASDAVAVAGAFVDVVVAAVAYVFGIVAADYVGTVDSAGTADSVDNDASVAYAAFVDIAFVEDSFGQLNINL